MTSFEIMTTFGLEESVFNSDETRILGIAFEKAWDFRRI
jgi:hypothetical protein